MDVQETDVVYLVAVRAREGNGGRSMQEVLKRLDFPSAGEYSAHAVARPLSEAYSLTRLELGPYAVPSKPAQNMNDLLRLAGFDFDSANMVVPVVGESS